MFAKLKQMSLKTKLIGVVLGIVLVGIAGTAAFFQYLISYTTEQKLEAFESFGLATNTSLSDLFYERYGDVQAFSKNAVLQRGTAEEMSKAFNDYIALYGIYDAIVLFDAKGKFVASNTVSVSGKELPTTELAKLDVSKEEWFFSTLAGKTTDDKAKALVGTYVTQPAIDSLSSALHGTKMYGNSFSATVLNPDGSVKGVLTARAGVRWLSAILDGALKQLKHFGLSNAVVTMFDGEGIVLVEQQLRSNSKANIAVEDFENIILKQNLATLGVFGAKEAMGGKSGVGWGVDPQSKEGYATVFEAIRNPKMVDELKWSVLIRAPRTEVLATVISLMTWFYIAMGCVALIGPAFAWYFAVGISNSVASTSTKLHGESAGVADAANQIASASTELSEAATEQAAALQETVSAVDEISAMVARNAETARRSADMSAASKETAARGKDTVQSMIQAINEIAGSNAEISVATEQSNHEISEIVKVIVEIGNKTKIINDIVFQTKLLSFNASVEAARAGEHGKGFAVVAEEVGNLAQMSGSAAKDITAMLESSIDKVTGIVENTKSKVGSLVTSARAKVENGTKVAGECGQALDAILRNVEQVSGLVGEIANASQEQAIGIQEVTKAMSQLDQVTQQNAAVATQAANSAEDLNSRAASLKVLVGELQIVVAGAVADENSALSAESTTKRVKEVASGAGSDVSKTVQPPAKTTEVGTTKSNVVSINRNQPKVNPIAEPVVEQKVVGSDVQLPSADDPRFKDI